MKSILETAREDGRLSTSVRMVEAGGMMDYFQKEGPYTAFVPIDEAYARIPQEKLGAIMSDREQLTSMVKYHVVQGKLTVLELARMEAIRTLQGDHLDISTSPEGTVRLNDAFIVHPDVECTNGMYHIIDRVLIPRAVNARVEKSI